MAGYYFGCNRYKNSWERNEDHMARTDKKLPVGVDSFEKLIRDGYYYLDKTGFIRQLMQWHGEVNLFTRPRRFGKTLNMGMLKSFFEIGTDKSLFDGLEISKEKAICDVYQGQYPVLFLSLKGIEGETFETAMNAIAELLSAECQRLSASLDLGRVNEYDRGRLEKLIKMETDVIGMRFAPMHMMRILHAYYGKKVILLIDEYDVPLDKASSKGYYGKMVDFLRGFFGEVFKTNPDLYFAVVTGCLRISKESIFTGLNNLKVDTISDERYDEYFGFTDADVRKILEDYGLFNVYDEIKEWYDGYRFGGADVYCPWDVVSHCDSLLQKPTAKPRLYWDNTSSNELVKRFIELADITTRRELEDLIAGEFIEKNIIENLTYGELEEDRDHLWSVLYLTGYLTVDRRAEGGNGMTRLVIPNREVREIFVSKIQKWFGENIIQSYQTDIYEELWNCQAEILGQKIRDILYDTISYHDYHENYYHALLVGILLNGAYFVKSNYETGAGRSDISIEDERGRRAIIIETKRSREYEDLEKDSEEVLEQIQNMEYAWPFQRKKYQVIAYGISCEGKECYVKVRQL